MKHFFPKLFSWFFLLLPGWAAAQNGTGPAFTIRGTVTDPQQKPIPFATVALYRTADSVLVTGAVSDEAGKFEIPSRPGQYHLKLSMLSFREKTLPDVRVADGDVQVGVLTMEVSTAQLDEVVVQGQRSSMELTLDKKVFNVGQDLASRGGTAVDILGNVPAVAVDAEGNVSLRGSGNVRILIDGKPSGLVSGNGGLQQLQGSSIERVEVITNPSARYEAEGMAGIINIVLKKERKEGFNGSFDLIAGQPDNFGAAANVNYRRKNLNFFVNYTASYRDTPGRNTLYQEVYRNDTTFITRQRSNSRLNGMYNNARAGLDYYLDDKNVLTGAYTWRISKGKRFTDIEYLDYLFTTGNYRGTTYRRQDETETEPNAEYALSYKRSFAREGHELVADVRFLDNWEQSDQFYTQQTVRGNGRPVDDPLQRSLNDETEKQLLGQLDYVHPFGKDGKFEAGLRSSFRDMTNNYSVTQRTEPDDWQPIDSLTNNFLYEEDIHAAYLILGNKVRKISYQVGLRAEWTGVTTTLRLTDQVNPRTYANLFPSVHLTYGLPLRNDLQVSYSRRVRRPQYNDLSPFMTFSDNRNFFSGNPDLNPEFSDAFEVGHVKHLEQGSLSSSLYYRHTTGKIIRVRTVDTLGVSTTVPENLSVENSYGAEFAGSYQPRQWWKLDGSINFFRAITDGGNLDATFRADTYSWFARMISRFSFWQNADFQLRGNYEAPQQTPQGRRLAIATLDAAVSKDFLKNNATLTLNVLDVFNSRRFRSITAGENFYTAGNAQGRLRQVNLTFNYRLRQAKKKEKPTTDGDF
jgi:outer membrane receptor protein involved in Fe transport